MITVGIDHGTSGIKACIRENNKNTFFTMARTELKNKSFLEELKNYVALSDIDLISVCYSMGDGINKIFPIDKVKNRGVINIEGVGEKIGGGTKVYDEIKNSEIPAVVIPGLHKNTECMDERFRALYSHVASPEKISIAYTAYKTFGFNDFILSDISSNTVSLLIKDKKIFGGFDACIGAIGILHGPIDLEMIRDIDSHKITANEAFSTAGAIKIVKDRYKGVEDTKAEILKNYKTDERCRLAIDSLILSVAMEINSLMFLNKDKNIILAGSVATTEEYGVPEKLKEYLDGNIFVLDGESGALGGALIAEDILKGKRDILGIKVEGL
ncbi:methanogenesis marker 12 protein [Methanothermococcus sp.]|uniref:methanogenesis marker 12 protein n=1 Tax=Methanothermococcus sp. TaxID=2614238 RepID=UPI0025DFD2E3|nr:methanogenesis marker 12 protein [Methanothermococcus sp.]